MKIFCERFKELRVNNNLSAVKLSKILNVSDSAILKWKKGIITPTIDHLYDIARYFNVSTDYLLGLED